MIVKNEDLLDRRAAEVKIESCLKQNFHRIGHERPYKNVRPRIIAEEYMENVEAGELRDCKFFCFNGEPKAMFTVLDRNSGHVKFDYYDMESNHLDIAQKYPNAEIPSKKLNCFSEMIVLAEKLSFGIPRVRVDLYEVNGNIYFGEMTSFHLSGFIPFKPNNWGKVLRNWLILPVKKAERRL